MSDVISREKSVAFSGHRHDKIMASSSNPLIENDIRASIKAALKDAYSKGFRYFLTGMAEGFDLWAADELLNLKLNGRCPKAELIAVVPFRGQSQGFSPDSLKYYGKILKYALEVRTLSENYYVGCYSARNDHLVNNASMLICYYSGLSGGTRYTVSKARKSGLPVVNIYNPVPSLF